MLKRYTSAFEQDVTFFTLSHIYSAVKFMLWVEVKASLGVDPNAAGILNKLSEEVRAVERVTFSCIFSLLFAAIYWLFMLLFCSLYLHSFESHRLGISYK